ncbi:WecB/TagA/CpsF family glycosyltransferase [Amorphus sp. 3PC139-8]|uniref:WecB/TagA/CpsF family glycosyltransferase n=1 Tax=Amorphus sp. 3PC139-8 TaxID=2735676 RepID=UPI00345D7707
MQTPETARLFGLDVAMVDHEAAVAQILDWARSRPAHIVVTPNLDHVVKLRHEPDFRAAYEDADLIVADGMPFVWLSRLEGTPLPARVAGSELIEPVCRAAAQAGLSIFFLGSTEARLVAAETALKARVPGLKVAGHLAPPFGFRDDSAAQAEAADAVAASGADIVFLALSAPTQEIYATRYRNRFDCGVVLCIGAGLDFLSGDVARAPAWMQRGGLEWVWRTLQEPRRLAPRYGRIIWLLPQLMAAHRADQRARRSG